MNNDNDWKFDMRTQQWEHLQTVRVGGATKSYRNGVEVEEIFYAEYKFNPANPWNFPLQTHSK